MTGLNQAVTDLRRVVVTGGTGFVGMHLVDALTSRGVSVTSLSSRSGFDVASDDLALEGIDHVYHLAGLTYVPKAWADPVSFYRVNALGTVRMLDQCRQAKVPMTYVSAYVYGRPESLPIAETAPLRANNPYAFSKLAGEEACRFFGEVYGSNVRIMRLFNVYGPGQEASFLIPTIARQVLDPAVPEIVVADLEPRRDFVHVDDVVEALLAAPSLPGGSAYNVGGGRSWSVGDVISACLTGAGVVKPYRSRGERRENEIADVIADISAIGRACGWKPRTEFARGITSVIESLKPC